MQAQSNRRHMCSALAPQGRGVGTGVGAQAVVGWDLGVCNSWMP